jgi:hypothetical protein
MILRSADGLTWQPLIDVPLSEGSRLFTLADGGDRFVAVGTGPSGAIVLVSPASLVSSVSIPTPSPSVPSTPGASEFVFPERPAWPGMPAMAAGDVIVPGAGTGGCPGVLYQDRGYGADQCGPGSFALDVSASGIAAGSPLVIAYPADAHISDRTFAGEPVEFSVLAAPLSAVQDLPVGQQERLPDGAATIDLGGRLSPSGEAVLATAPSAPGDYLVQVSGSVSIGDWTWIGTRFYYRILVR